MAESITHDEIFRDKLKRKYKITISKDFIDEKIEEGLRAEQKNLIHPGFRKGKAPISIVKNVKGDAVANNTIKDQITKSFKDFLEDKNWKTAVEPNIVDIKVENDIKYQVEFELIPDAPSIDISSLPIKKESCNITDEDLAEYIDKLSEETFDFVEAEKDYKAKEGDTVYIDFIGKIDNKPFKGGTSEDFMVVLGGKEILPEIEESLFGASIGDEKDVIANFPPDYPMQDLASKQAVFSVSVKEISIKKPINTEEELIKYFDCENLEDFKESSMDGLNKHVESIIDTLAKKEFFDYLDEQYSFDVPESMVSLEMQKILEKFPDEKLRLKEAEKRVKLGFILVKLAQEHSITVNDNDISATLFSKAHGDIRNLQYMVNLYKTDQSALVALRGEILENKVTSFIIESMQTKEPSSVKELEKKFEEIEG